MDTPRRTAAKALTWQALGLLMLRLVGYALTGSVGVAGGFALINAGLGLVSYAAHERVWARIAWGRRTAAGL